MIVELKNIYKNYGGGEAEVRVLKDVTLSVAEGEYLAIMGPSGSGKSTLMNILGCLDRATSGTYLLDGQDVSVLSENELAAVRLNKIGFVFQTFQLLAGETAVENVALPLIYAGVSKEERIERAAAELEKVGLGDRIDFLPSQLSGGQKQRVAIARAMINGPRLILADEPTGALDQESGRQVMALFRKLNENGVTVVMITHDANIAANADKIVKIIDGRLIGAEEGETA
ncbi:MAG: ABC transporter ATP-binding protein [Eubacterium sp.]|jgi:putative ABC transport system ATP-binding protein